MDKKEIKKQKEQDEIQEDLEYYINELKSKGMLIYFCLVLLAIILSLFSYFSDNGAEKHQAPAGEPKIVVSANLDNSARLVSSAYLENKDSLENKVSGSNVLSLQKEVKSLEKVPAELSNDSSMNN